MDNWKTLLWNTGHAAFGELIVGGDEDEADEVADAPREGVEADSRAGPVAVAGQAGSFPRCSPMSTPRTARTCVYLSKTVYGRCSRFRYLNLC